MIPSTTRYGYIDLFRGWAVIVMIEVHVVNAFLNPFYRENKIFDIVNFINGIVAPSFLFLAGYSFMILLDRKREEFTYWSKLVLKNILRFIGILIVGYMLRIPFYSYQRIFTEVSDKLISNFLRVDILHCISITMLILIFIFRFIKNQKIFVYLLSALIILFVGFTNFMWSTDFNNILPLGIANYFNQTQGSLFPLFPWSSFLLTGTLTSYFWLKWRSDKYEQKYFLILLLIGCIFAIIGITYQYFLKENSDQLYLRVSPFFFITRIGVVFVLLSFMWFWEQKFGTKKSAVAISGKESLLIYVCHLLVIYGMFIDEKSLAFIIKKTLLPNEVTIFSLILILAMVSIGLIWNKIKIESSRLTSIIKILTFTIAIIYFFTN
ncbi:MAG: heparan-alpha-glucosaminide N-acetyltransferase domain-containing protein [Bacteroidetes bacterium]|nr:heparan-alpha-glucosaminide N-acetyltransferase domain-containing protein [Bacteroidota bacterium]